MARRSLQTGIAYHGNRMPNHYRADLAEMAKADMDIVVHMLTHTDWERHGKVMKDICKMTIDAGMEVWMDNWGLAGSPGDKSHFLALHPEAHMVMSNGEMHPTQVCFNNPDFRKFVHDWLEVVADMQVTTIFWDEPCLPVKNYEGEEGEGQIYTCCCPVCRKLFEEKYGHPMPLLKNEEATEFRMDSMADFFRDVTEYANKLGLKNSTCLMPPDFFEADLKQIKKLCDLPYMDNIGTDPYWSASKRCKNVYEYVYERTKKMMDVTTANGKEHNLWIQTYAHKAGTEETIIQATEAAYDAGARCILGWSYAGAESNDYRSENPEKTWQMTIEAFRRIRSMERDRILAENRALYRK